MDKEQLKKSVLINLRCVTQSSKLGVPLNKLQREYKDLLGSEIPVKDLGYSSLEEFLRSIPNVISLKRNKEGLLSAEGVADASTAHIASLVSRQKASKKSKSKSGRPSVLTRKWGNSVKVTSQENQKPSSVNFHNLSPGTYSKPNRRSSESAQLNPEQKELKKSVLMNLRSVVQSSKCGVPLSHLQRDYRQFIGTIIPFKYLGYSSLEEFVQSIPKVINVKKDINGQLVAVAVPDPTTAHLFNPASKQKSAKTKVLTPKASPKRLAKDAVAIQISSQKNTKIPLFVQLTQNSVETYKANNPLKEPSMKAVPITHDVDKYVGKAVQLSKCETTKENKQEKDNIMKMSVLGYLKSVIQNSGGSLPLSMIPSIYKHDVGSNIPFTIFGFNSLENFMQSLSGDFNLKRDKNGELIVETVSETPVECANNLALEKKSKVVKPHAQIQPKYVPPMFRSKISPPSTSAPAASSSSMIYIPPPLRNRIPVEVTKSATCATRRATTSSAMVYIPPPLRKKLENEVAKSTTCITKSASTFQATHSFTHAKDESKNHACIPESRKVTMRKKRIKHDSFSSNSSICESLVHEKLAKKDGNLKSFHSSSTELGMEDPCGILTGKRTQRKRIRDDSSVCSSTEGKNATYLEDLNMHWSKKTEECRTTNLKENIINTSAKSSFEMCNPSTDLYPEIKNNISKACLNVLIHLHFLLFGVCNKAALKKKIESFSGFPYSKHSEERRKKEHLLLQLSVPDLRCCASSLGIQLDDEDDSISLLGKITEFLESGAESLVVKGADHSTLLHLHFIVSGVSNLMTLKRKLLSFTGFPFSKASQKWNHKVKFAKKFPLHILQKCLTVLCIQFNDVNDGKVILLCKLEQFLQAYAKPEQCNPSNELLYLAKNSCFVPVEKDLSSSKLSALLHLHFLLYGAPNMDMLKEEILSFTGFSFSTDSEEWEIKLSLASKLSKKNLQQCLTFLCIQHDVLDDKKRLLSKLVNHLAAYTKIKNTADVEKVQEVIMKDSSSSRITTEKASYADVLSKQFQPF